MFKSVIMFVALSLSVFVSTAQAQDMRIQSFGIDIGAPYKYYNYADYLFGTKINVLPKNDMPKVFSRYQITLTPENMVHTIYAEGNMKKKEFTCPEMAYNLAGMFKNHYLPSIISYTERDGFYEYSGRDQRVKMYCEGDTIYYEASLKKDLEEPTSKVFTVEGIQNNL
jgi:hypothetical protein